MTRRKWAIATASAASLFGASFAAIAVLDDLEDETTHIRG